MKATTISHVLKRHLTLLLFSTVYIALALVTYKDFGMTWDETVNYDRGVLTYMHLFSKIVSNPFKFNKTNGHLDIKEMPEAYPLFKRYLNLKRQRFRDYYYYSGFYPMMLFALNKDKSIERYHLLNMVFALGIFVSLYALLYHHYKDQRIAILGPLVLFFTPRFIGHIPANPKDMPFAVLYFMSCTVLYLFAPTKKILAKIMALGVLFGLTQNIRIAGITLYGILVMFDTYTYYLEKQKNPELCETGGQFIIREIQTVILVGSVALLVSVLTWPYLGINVISNAQEILRSRINFPWKHTVLYQGSLVKGSQLPGHYLLTWIAITMPLIILIPALLSPLAIKKRLQNRVFVLLLLVLVTNLTLYAIIQPVVYDGLRHFLFIVPMISALGVLAIIECLRRIQQRYVKRIITLIALVNMALIAKEIISLHPYQYIFFNALVGGVQGAHKKFDTEYWGASYNEAINWFKENIATDSSRRYRIHIWGIRYYTIYQAPNIVNVPSERADYIFRLTRRMQEEPRQEDIVHVVQRNNTPLVFITRNRRKVN